MSSHSSNTSLDWSYNHHLSASTTSGSLPATKGKRSKGVTSLMGASKPELMLCSQEATAGGWLKFARQSGSSDGLRISLI
jgi:hypothetical protein